MLPTLADLCGLKIPGGRHLDGTSLAGLFRGTQSALPDRMLVVQYSRINSPKPAKGDAAVLWGKWRLVGNRELYDIATDPAQAHDLAAEHSEIVEKMRDHYDKWWAEIEPTVNQMSPITVGSDAENPTLLSPADWADVFLDQSSQVRQGLSANGLWNIQVDRGGDYEIRLRRWPEESHLALGAADPPAEMRQDANPVVGRGPSESVPGKALPIASARLRVGDQEQAIDVDPADQAAVFNLRLQPGRTQFQTWFYGPQGGELCGAYYVYVRRK